MPRQHKRRSKRKPSTSSSSSDTSSSSSSSSTCGHDRRRKRKRVPSEVFFGYRIRMNNDMITDDDNTERSVDVTALRNTVDANIKKDAEQQKSSFDAKRKDAPNYNVGDLVVLKIPSHSNDGQSTKLMPLYKGPFQVTKILGHDRYQVADMRGAERSSKRYDGIACVENMKPWIRIAK